MNIQKNAFSIFELKSVFREKGDQLGDTVFVLLKSFDLLKLCLKSGIVKTKGYSAKEILIILFLFPFMLVDTIRSFILRGCPLTLAQKDTFYRFLNEEWFDWRKMLAVAAKKFRALTAASELTGAVTCGIIDDSLLEKSGEKIEGIGKVFDHIKKRFVLGFRCLLYCCWDGKSIYPLDFSLHAEKGKDQKRPYGLNKKKLKKRYSKERDPKSPGSKRVKELYRDKINTALSMIKRAAKHGFVPHYLLCDCWFASEKFITTIRQIKQGAVHFLGMVRQDKRRYLYNGKELTAAELLKQLKPSAKRCRKINSRYIEVVVEYKTAGKLKLFFSRFSRQGQWKLLATTDLKLNYLKSMEIYSLRWGIEVVFKECKQHLNLGKCQSNDFDAQIAETSISLLLYIMLAFHKRTHAYETLGLMFAHLKNQFLEATIAERLWLIFLELQKILAEIFEIDLEEYFHRLINSEKAEALLRSFIAGLLPPDMELKIDNAA
jgi:hypothetical protein